ncbi:MAG: AraC family transcriptional regulator, partial [Steroidobacteraceae bacterium]
AADYQNVPRPIAVLAVEYPPGFIDVRHSHRRAQLLYACAGVMSVMTENDAFVVPPLRAVWLPGGTQHEVHYRGPVSLRTLYVEPRACPNLPAKCRVIEISDFLRALILEATNLPVEYDLNGRGGRIMTLLLDEITAMPVAPLHAPMPADERLARICRAIFKAPAQNDSLEDWARVSGMSRCTLARLFRRETGMSFAAWRQHVRLLEALSRLAIGHSVTTVALDIGYNSPSAFTAMFHRTFGTTPSQYYSAKPGDAAVEESDPVALTRA